MSEEKGAYARGCLPGMAQLFNQLSAKPEKVDRVLALKAMHIIAGPELEKAKETIKQNIATKPMAPSTERNLKMLLTACQSYHSIADELFKEIEHLRLQQ